MILLLNRPTPGGQFKPGAINTADCAVILLDLELSIAMANPASRWLSVFKWFETDGLISQRRDWLIGFKV
uniref:hypothetical protein n=1 Tax=Limnohabitans sp. TaxID=1907725 RepID=UPI00404706B3